MSAIVISASLACELVARKRRQVRHMSPSPTAYHCLHQDTQNSTFPICFCHLQRCAGHKRHKFNGRGQVGSVWSPPRAHLDNSGQYVAPIKSTNCLNPLSDGSKVAFAQTLHFSWENISIIPPPQTSWKHCCYISIRWCLPNPICGMR